MTIVLVVGMPIAAGILYALWMSRKLRTLQRLETSSVTEDDGPSDEPTVSLDFWEQRRAR